MISYLPNWHNNQQILRLNILMLEILTCPCKSVTTLVLLMLVNVNLHSPSWAGQKSGHHELYLLPHIIPKPTMNLSILTADILVQTANIVDLNFSSDLLTSFPESSFSNKNVLSCWKSFSSFPLYLTNTHTHTHSNLYHSVPGQVDLSSSSFSSPIGGHLHASIQSSTFFLVLSEVKSFSRVRLFVTPWTAVCQAPLSMGFSRQEYWSGFPVPSQWIFPIQGPNLGLPHCRQILYQLSHQGSSLGSFLCPNLSWSLWPSI